MLIFNFKDINKDITLEYILDKVSQEDIIFMCLGNVDLNKPINSPLRKEKNPSFTFKKLENGNIIWKDWGSGNSGNVFNLVEEIYGVNFSQSLKIIYEKLIKNNSSTLLVKRDKQDYNKIEFKSKKINKIFINKGIFDINDYNYWTVNYKIKIETLNKFNVFKAKEVYLSKYSYINEKYDNWKLIKIYTKNNPVYAYEFKYSDNISYKIYSPFSDKKGKWFFNGTTRDIEGYGNLPLNGELLIITKSLKDVMCLHELGYNSISLQGEHNRISKDLLDKLNKRFDKIILFYDNDDSGILASEKIKKENNLNYILIPSELETKDISDTVKKYGINFSKELLKKII
jgi:hypothetical protein